MKNLEIESCQENLILKLIYIYVCDICLYKIHSDFTFHYFLALKFLQNLHKL